MKLVGEWGTCVLLGSSLKISKQNAVVDQYVEPQIAMAWVVG